MRAFCIVFSPAAILRFPYTHLTIYLVYYPVACSIRLINVLYFYVFELLPFVDAIFLKLVNIFSIVKGSFAFFLVKKESIVFCVDLEF